MLISHQKRFLFIHIQKTAGSSLRELLSENVGDLQSYMGTHDHADWAKENAEFEWDEYYKFAFVRNPWDRLVSWYTMITEQSGYLIQQGNESAINALWQYTLDNSTCFEEFVCNCTGVIDDVDGRKSFLYNQLDYLTDPLGNLIVDFVGRYESLEFDAQQLFKVLELSGLTLPRYNVSSRTHYRDYYDNTTREIVGERYAKDINYFGYTF